MARVSQVLPTVSGDATLPQLDYATVVAAGYVVPEFEDGAKEDYLFDDATAGLRSRVNGSKLTPVGSAPTWKTGYLTLAGGINGLLMKSGGELKQTFAAVVRRPTTGPASALALIGNEQASASAGAGIFVGSGGGVALRVRPSTTYPEINSATGGAAIAAGAWMFVAGALDGNTATLFLGAPTPITRTGTHTRDFGSNLGIGKVRDMGTSYNDDPLDVHRAVAFSGKAMTIAELTALYERCKIVAARRGITVV